MRRASTGIAGRTFGAFCVKKEGEAKILRFGRASRICCVSDKSRSGNLQIAKRTGIRIHVDDDGNVNTYTRNDVATHVASVTHLRCSRPRALRDALRLRGTTVYVPTRRCGYIFYKTFLIPRRITGETRKG